MGRKLREKMELGKFSSPSEAMNSDKGQKKKKSKNPLYLFGLNIFIINRRLNFLD